MRILNASLLEVTMTNQLTKLSLVQTQINLSQSINHSLLNGT